MLLWATKRFKDGKGHFYWRLVENVRVGRRVFQRQALYLGDLNDSLREEWQHAIGLPWGRLPWTPWKPYNGVVQHLETTDLETALAPTNAPAIQ